MIDPMLLKKSVFIPAKLIIAPVPVCTASIGASIVSASFCSPIARPPAAVNSPRAVANKGFVSTGPAALIVPKSFVSAPTPASDTPVNASPLIRSGLASAIPATRSISPAIFSNAGASATPTARLSLSVCTCILATLPATAGALVARPTSAVTPAVPMTASLVASPDTLLLARSMSAPKLAPSLFTCMNPCLTLVKPVLMPVSSSCPVIFRLGPVFVPVPPFAILL